MYVTKVFQGMGSGFPKMLLIYIREYMREIHKISIISIVIVGLFQEGGEAGKITFFFKSVK